LRLHLRMVRRKMETTKMQAPLLDKAEVLKLFGGSKPIKVPSLGW